MDDAPTLLILFAAAGLLMLRSGNVAGAPSIADANMVPGYSNFLAPSRSGLSTPNYAYGGYVPASMAVPQATTLQNTANLLGVASQLPLKRMATAVGGWIGDSGTILDASPTPPVILDGADSAAAAAGTAEVADAVIGTSEVADAVIGTSEVATAVSEGASWWEGIISFFSFF